MENRRCERCQNLMYDREPYNNRWICTSKEAYDISTTTRENCSSFIKDERRSNYYDCYVDKIITDVFISTSKWYNPKTWGTGYWKYHGSSFA